MKQYVIYSRQSKKSYMKGQMTLETADAIINYYLNTQREEGVDYEVVKVFKAVGYSYRSKSANRINFNEAYELCKQNGYSLLVSTASRLARNRAYLFQIIKAVKEKCKDDPDFEFNATYICTLVDRMMGESGQTAEDLDIDSETL